MFIYIIRWLFEMSKIMATGTVNCVTCEKRIFKILGLNSFGTRYYCSLNCQVNDTFSLVLIGTLFILGLVGLMALSLKPATSIFVMVFVIFLSIPIIRVKSKTKNSKVINQSIPFVQRDTERKKLDKPKAKEIQVFSPILNKLVLRCCSTLR